MTVIYYTPYAKWFLMVNYLNLCGLNISCYVPVKIRTDAKCHQIDAKCHQLMTFSIPLILLGYIFTSLKYDDTLASIDVNCHQAFLGQEL